MAGVDERGVVRGDTRRELKDLLREASLALAQLDVARLEVLAASCDALNRRPVEAQEARDAVSDMAVFGRVLEAAQRNAEVMQRLRGFCRRNFDYFGSQTRSARVDSGYGHD